MYDDTLNVWTNGHHVGYLWRDERNNISFQYSEEWLENPLRFPVSKTLPLHAEPYEADAESRIRICREKKISVDNDFELLRAIGGECAGALSILADKPDEVEPRYQQLSTANLTELLHKRNPSVVVEEGDNPPRLSLAGAQDKVPVKYEDGIFYIPLDNNINTYPKVSITRR